MIWKKNVFSFLLWLLYAFIAGISLVAYLAVFCTKMGYPGWCGIALTGLWTLTGLLLMQFSRRRRKPQPKAPGRAPSWNIAEGAAVVLLLAAGLVIRIMEFAPDGEGSAYFEYAKVAEGAAIPQVVHGIDYLYLKLLHLVFLVLGNKIMAGYWLQLALQMLAVLVFYFAVRRLSGAVPAAGLLLFVSVSPYIRAQVLTLSPRMLLFFLYGAALWLMASGLDGEKGTPVRGLFAGLLAGLLIYLDIAGVTLALFAAGIFLAGRGKADSSLKGKAAVYLSCQSGVVLGFAAAVLADSLSSKKGWGNIVLALGKLYAPQESPDIMKLITWYAEMNDFEILVLLLLMSIGIFSFWCNRRSDELGIWTLALLPTLAAACFGMFTVEADGYLWIYLFMTAAAGASVSNILKAFGITAAGAGEQDAREENMDEAIRNIIHRETANGAAVDSGTASGGSMNRVKRKAANREAIDKETADSETRNDGAGSTITVNVEGKTREVRLLDNPLPLPKKHIRKALDFDYDIKEDDDFDI